MSFSPDPIELISRARSDLQVGVPVVLANESTSGLIILAAETANQSRLEDIVRLGDEVSLTITEKRATTLRARAYDGDIARIILPEPPSIGWVQSIADPARDLNSPMKGPFKTLRDGDVQLERAAVALVKSARLLPAVVVAKIDAPAEFAQLHGLTVVDPSDATLAPTQMSRVVSARVPLEVSEAGRLHVFRPNDGAEEHYAVEIGAPDRSAPVLARLHSACFTGDLLGSLKCDCGPQLRAALAHMGADGSGVLLYLNQEGRGIGLANKMRAYSLQDQGFDTVEANHRLGFEDDERDFSIGALMLKEMGFASVRLLTNNPAKIDRLESCGVKVAERVPLKVGETRENVEYLKTKAKKSGHLL